MHSLRICLFIVLFYTASFNPRFGASYPWLKHCSTQSTYGTQLHVLGNTKVSQNLCCRALVYKPHLFWSAHSVSWVLQSYFRLTLFVFVYDNIIVTDETNKFLKMLFEEVVQDFWMLRHQLFSVLFPCIVLYTIIK